VQPPASVVSVTADGEALEPTATGFVLPEQSRPDDGAIDVVVTYAGGATAALTMVAGAHCHQSCSTPGNCDGYGLLLAEAVEYDVLATELRWTHYTCEWQHANEEGGN